MGAAAAGGQVLQYHIVQFVCSMFESVAHCKLMKSKGRQSHEAGTHDRMHRLFALFPLVANIRRSITLKAAPLKPPQLLEKVLNACQSSSIGMEGLRQPEMREDL